MAALEKELETYKRELPNLIKNSGKFVLIKGDDVIDTFDSYADALKLGYAKFSLDPFLVKQISQTEQISFFTRNLELCPA
ncbi:hypothetical protein [Pandoraea sputorum]|uniref:DUF5678 domain-containing protein n=1 Tax=Pandoraea sputorum TaxID=93222 RepID=A0A5E5BDT6_9BURK|nr:hypothetical protein [Pandoraea sputorum]VVE82803.1 hypothetical protein PSP31121_03975 [Pandoraea sputorum]